MSEQFLRGEGVFEITDYTTASDWERFISSLEDVLTEFKLNKQSDKGVVGRELPEGFISSGLWHERHETLRFGKVTFDVRYQYLDDTNLTRKSRGTSDCDKQESQPKDDSSSTESLEWRDADNQELVESSEELIEEKKEHGEHELPADLPESLQDIISTNNDFASKAHCLVRWYNFRKFIVLIPRGDTIISEDRIKLVLSSASVALANIDCHVPLFVQTHNPKNHFYQGISEHSNIRTMYEMIYYRQSLNQYAYLSELINLFREKIGCHLNDPISATIRINYCLDFFELFVDKYQEFTGEEFEDEDQDELVKMTEDKKKKTSQVSIQDMRSGATLDQVREIMNDVLPHPYKILKFIHVAALWPPISDKVITDSRVHSDLDPVEAPIWTMRCVTNDNCNMKIVHETQAINDLLRAAINWAYDRLDAGQIFTDCDRAQLESECLKLSYELATKPEVVVSRSPSDSIRKLIALLFHRSSELKAEMDALDQIAAQLKKQPSLSEIYRDFKRTKASVKEFIIRTQISRPFSPISTPALPQRMFCTICDNEFRLCGAFSELCN